ncbi:twin-arginine translocase TatA/TatE family subunit [Nocardioides sp. J2M5]|uniref:twin-arginine translocase TatA/TatE family subunit n=1 Tax=Nocardioides palaemonis TaxID=2829810 RepID=UPI001BA9F2D3|nr:twin-arginine translocase TatA/TatE family subunit [Nocardioides palaemonis]MBS2938468.1 twin-arginine translocase TatA/TatE family subunit [Nocardioides palaemonis]
MTSTLISPLLVGGLGGMELLIILAVLVLLFGASKLPELARGSGQALRIFKAETKGLTDSDKDAATTPVAETPASEPIIVETPREHDAQRG